MRSSGNRLRDRNGDRVDGGHVVLFATFVVLNQERSRSVRSDNSDDHDHDHPYNT